MRLSTRLLHGLLLFLIGGMALTASAQVRKYSNEFLNIGIGARSLAMSGATSAVIGDVTSAYWNPAGLAGVSSDVQIGAMHSEYFAGIAKYDYAAVAIPVKGGDRHLGISMIRFGVDDIPNTLFLFEPDGSINYDNITSFSVADYAFLLSYAQKLKVEGLRVGGSAKVIYRNAGSFAQAWGFGLDLGLQYARNNWRFGLTGRDITTTFNAWSFSFTEEEKEVLQNTGNVIPESSYEITAPRIVLGVGYDWDISDKFGMLAEVDIHATTDGRRNTLVSADPISLDPNMGLELDYADFIFLRAGMGNIQQATSDEDLEKRYLVQPNLGLGIRFKGVQLDYAYTNLGNRDQLLYSNIFSLMLDINKRSGEKSTQTDAE
jgi:hypothetical protein